MVHSQSNNSLYTRDEIIPEPQLTNPDTDYYRLTVETDLEAEYDTVFNADNKDYENKDFLLHINSAISAEIFPHLNIESDLIAVLNGVADGIRQFGAQYEYKGLYVENILLRYKTDSFIIFGGKYEPAEDIFNLAPLFFGNYSNNLDLIDSMGLGSSFMLHFEDASEHILTWQVFYLDTSRLSKELFSGRGGHNISDGGVGNTGQLNNFLITINGTIESMDSLNYTLGLGERIGENNDLLNEHSLLGSLLTTAPWFNDSDLEISADYLLLRNAGGQDEDTTSFTFGLNYSVSSYQLGITYSRRITNPGNQDEENSTGHIMEFVTSYTINQYIDFEGAYQWTREYGEEENSIGLLLRYNFDAVKK